MFSILDSSFIPSNFQMQNREEVNMDAAVEDLPTLLESAPWYLTTSVPNSIGKLRIEKKRRRKETQTHSLSSESHPMSPLKCSQLHPTDNHKDHLSPNLVNGMLYPPTKHLSAGDSRRYHTRRSAPVMLQKLGCDSDMMDTKLRNVREKLGFSDVHGDCARFVPVIKELNGATDATNRKDSPSGIIMRKKVGGSGKNLHLPVKNPVRTGIPEDCKGARKEGKKARNVSVRDKVRSLSPSLHR
ncbi:hypothetical protein MKW98_005918 [Papaver atlanticum]|uniref:Uncharacterized protein n=1 Tax=Papaver atlanticum TaxID=357466 RepID=A0AAD4TDU2_9MAGN|nr:hypothetical protein MKW98_005918 [Papaver atlanticum]